MFGNKILLVNFLKLSKIKIKRQGVATFSFCNSKSRDSCHPKVSNTLFIKTNDFRSRTLLSKNSVEIKKTKKYLSYNMLDNKCWKCKGDKKPKSIECPSCGALQYPPDNITFFELLGISQTYEIDIEDLSKKFKNLQKITHPDKYMNKTAEELEISESYTRLLNRAFTTLKDPLSRGLYLLELLQIKTEKFDVEPQFLMFIMEKNEELECRNTLASLSLFMEENSLEMDKEIKKISESFRFNNPNEAKSSLMKLNYYRNLDKKIKDKHTKLSGTDPG